MKTRSLTLAAAGLLVLASAPARAIPSFARKYGTSCTTCHTVYPKLTPFGEAFRRNGFRFPGLDSDYAKQETVTTKAKAPGVEPSWVSAVPPLSLGANGQVRFHPSKSSSGALADANGAGVVPTAVLSELVDEAHLWAGGTITDSVSYFAEVTFARDGTIDVEHLQVHFNDLIGPAHAVNLRVGRGFSNLSSFGPHSSYLADALQPPTGVAGLNGAIAGGWNAGDHFSGVEVSGVLGGNLGYHVGWNAGSSVDSRTAEDLYAHLGWKLGGMRLDGEGKSDSNPERPWEEKAITFDAFAYHAAGSVDFGTAEVSNLVLDTVNTVGGGLRAQWGSWEFSAGLSLENHKRAEAGLTSATFLTQYDELSYIVFPWLVPAVRFEFNQLSPDSSCRTADGSACASVSDWRLWPGVALLPYPNLKVVLTAMFESASGTPPAGWGAAGGFATSNAGVELQSVQIYSAFAF